MCRCGEAKCRKCRLRKIGQERLRYRFTPALVERLTEAYSSPTRQGLTKKLDALVAATRWPRFVFTAEAQRRGIVTVTVRRWTREEEDALRERAGRMSVGAIARELKRSERSVESRLQALGASLARTEGYNITDLAQCFGVGPQKVQRWMERGLLGKAHDVGGVNGRRVTETNVARFIRRHHGEYDMRRVDQVWFKAMVFEEATCRDGR